MGILKVYLRWGNRLSPGRKNPLKKPGRAHAGTAYS